MVFQLTTYNNHGQWLIYHELSLTSILLWFINTHHNVVLFGLGRFSSGPSKKKRFTQRGDMFLGIGGFSTGPRLRKTQWVHNSIIEEDCQMSPSTLTYRVYNLYYTIAT